MSYQCSFYLQIYASWKGWSGRYLCKRGWFSSPWALWVWNNLSGILWMWNPLMRFLLFLDYPHIVSARQPGVGQGCAGGEHCQGGRQAPVLNSLSCLPVFGNLDQVNDQNRCMQASNKIHSCLQNLCTYSMHLCLLFFKQWQLLSSVFCARSSSNGKHDNWGQKLCARWSWSEEMRSHFLGKPPTAALPSISIPASTARIIFTRPCPRLQS